MPRKGTSLLDDVTILSAALAGLEAQREKLDEQIAQLRARLAELASPRPAPVKRQRVTRVARKKRTLSPEARQRIREAQKRRWAEFRKRMGEEQAVGAESAQATQPAVESEAGA